jgi:hypothetical protein
MLNTYTNLTTRVFPFFLQHRFKNLLFPPNLLENLAIRDLIDCITSPKKHTKAIV